MPSPINFNPYLSPTGHQRNDLHYTVYEGLFYNNYLTGETIPWLAQSFEWNKEFTELTIKLRDKVTWATASPSPLTT